MTDDELLVWVERGIVPLPDESEASFLERVVRFPSLPPSIEQSQAGQITKALFGFSANWIPVVYSNQRLSLWEAGATWIDPNQFPYVQLRKTLMRKAYFGVSRAEILSHEAVHAVRMLYREPIFEEMLAYATSLYKWRQFWGPLFRTPAESILLLLFLLGGLLCASLGVLYVALLPLALFAFWIFRLCYYQILFRKACRRYPLSLLIWLSDHEIKQAAKTSLQWAGETLRARFLRMQIAKIKKTPAKEPGKNKPQHADKEE